MDVLLKEFVQHHQRKNWSGKLKAIRARNISPKLQRILFSIGTPKVINDKQIHFNDIIPFHLRVRCRTSNKLEIEAHRLKEIDTTDIIDHVKSCLSRMNKPELSADAISDLCQVVGEVLINAEEHSTTDYRYLIGYFEEKHDPDHYGIFHLVVFNFGDTIYDKFKDPNCPVPKTVERMKELSASYTKRKFFSPAKFEEETLWTLYSLQERITSKTNYKNRGNGSIRFIESFLNLADNPAQDRHFSKMAILSGHTRIIFDGKYRLHSKTINNETYQVITFNESGKIEETPDPDYVNFAKEYFPGTMIVAKIRIGTEDTRSNPTYHD